MWIGALTITSANLFLGAPVGDGPTPFDVTIEQLEARDLPGLNVRVAEPYAATQFSAQLGFGRSRGPLRVLTPLLSRNHSDMGTVVGAGVQGSLRLPRPPRDGTEKRPAAALPHTVVFALTTTDPSDGIPAPGWVSTVTGVLSLPSKEELDVIRDISKEPNPMVLRLREPRPGGQVVAMLLAGLGVLSLAGAIVLALWRPKREDELPLDAGPSYRLPVEPGSWQPPPDRSLPATEDPFPLADIPAPRHRSMAPGVSQDGVPSQDGGPLLQVGQRGMVLRGGRTFEGVIIAVEDQRCRLELDDGRKVWVAHTEVTVR